MTVWFHSLALLALCLVASSLPTIDGRQDAGNDTVSPVLREGGSADPYPNVTSGADDRTLLIAGERRMEWINQTYQHALSDLLSTRERSNHTCTAENVGRRKEWANLSFDERQDYIRAVKCLHSRPAKTSKALAPGARTRWDDFVVAHILNTKHIHFSGLLLPWHRQFTWMLEDALRNECNYSGYQPYWDWSRHAFLPSSENPVYSGNESSLGGNGKPVPHRGNLLQAGGNPPVTAWVPPGTGGGCIESGPFAEGKWETNLGPVSTLNDSIAGGPNPQADGLGYNPRCVTRDFNEDFLRSNSNYWNVSALILNNTSIGTFHSHLGSAARGVHGTGHTFIGGLNDDLFSSPGDPLFFLHHSMIDRLWSMWQSLDFANRTNALNGTMTSFNWPPSKEVTLDDHLYFSPVFENITIRDVMSTTGGKYCYAYE